jgi:hypothetical protein
MKLSDILSAPLWTDAKFYFALFNMFVIFAPRWGLVLTSEEIASVNLLIAVAFGVGRPSAEWVQMRIAARHLRQAQATGIAQYDGLKVK